MHFKIICTAILIFFCTSIQVNAAPASAPKAAPKTAPTPRVMVPPPPIVDPILYQNTITPLLTADDITVQFPSDYISARERFRKKAAQVKSKFPGTEVGLYKVPSVFDRDLTTDHIFIPRFGSKKLLLITSGMHGAEAYTGHALQMWYLEKLLHTGKLPNFNILIVHTINPYGAKYFQRTNENNVDLNRNFASAKDFKSTNAEYDKLRPLLEPDYKASGYLLTTLGFYAKAAWSNLRLGKKFILGSLRGQYQYPTGIFYGGDQLQSETKSLQKLIRYYAASAADIYHVDVHTGFGEKNKLHFFGSDDLENDPSVAKNEAALKKVIGSYKVDTASDKDFYATTGDIGDWLWREFRNKRVVPMTFEFGTMDSQTMLGGLNSLRITVLENQGHHHGFLSNEDHMKSFKDLEKLFNPQSLEWQSAVLKSGTEALNTTLKNFEAL